MRKSHACAWQDILACSFRDASEIQSVRVIAKSTQDQTRLLEKLLFIKKNRSRHRTPHMWISQRAVPQGILGSCFTASH
eukprot:3140995-Pleurochrysis_carterae.AAC.9